MSHVSTRPSRSSSPSDIFFSPLELLAPPPPFFADKQTGNMPHALSPLYSQNHFDCCGLGHDNCDSTWAGRVRFHVMPRPSTIATVPIIVVSDVYRCLLFLIFRVLFRTPPHPPCVIFSSVACAIASLPSKMRYRCPKSGWFNESLDSCYVSGPQFRGVLSAPNYDSGAHWSILQTFLLMCLRRPKAPALTSTKCTFYLSTLVFAEQVLSQGGFVDYSTNVSSSKH